MELIEAIGTAFFFVHYHLVLCVMTAINLCKAMLPFKNTSKIRGINPVAQTHSHVFSTLGIFLTI